MCVSEPLAHRRLLPCPDSFRPFEGTDLFARIGGQPTVDALVDRLYDAVEQDPVLRPLFGRDLGPARAGQKAFFADWFGGGRDYSDRTHSSLRHRHDDVAISETHADRWLAHFRQALAQVVPSGTDRAAIATEAAALARALVNTAGVGSHVAACGPGARTVKAAADRARQGDLAGLATALAQAPDLARASHGARLMQAAALGGRAEAVRLLLEHGVGPDVPHFLPVNVVGRAFERVVLVTPLCAARYRRRGGVERTLSDAGAVDDVFTAAFLGDIDHLRRQIAADAGLVGARDPAADVLDITPVDHAVAGGQDDALRVLLAHSGPIDGVRALRGAAEQNRATMVERLLESGADATRIGPGRWVLHPTIAPMLAAHGASVGSAGTWIGLCCTGNQGRKDDPAYVRALLRYGARADDRRTGDSGAVASLGGTALHFAARAGFAETIVVLLDHGADPAATDNQGRTPVDWLQDAAPRVDRERIRRLLTSPAPP